MIMYFSKKRKKHKRKREHDSDDEIAVDDDALRHGTCVIIDGTKLTKGII